VTKFAIVVEHTSNADAVELAQRILDALQLSVAVGYVVSRGLAKLATRQPKEDSVRWRRGPLSRSTTSDHNGWRALMRIGNSEGRAPWGRAGCLAMSVISVVAVCFLPS
jgi:hypothetical protein